MKERFKKIWKKVEYFWEYYKWAVIIPVIVVYLTVYTICSLVDENREIALRVAFVNTSDTYDTEQLIQNDYADFRGIDTKELPIRIEGGFVQPKVMDDTAAANSSTVASIQKYGMMITSSKIDVTIGSPWVALEYEKNDAYEDLRDVLSDEQMSEWKDRIMYCENSKGEKVPVGIYVDGLINLGEFYEEGKPVVTISTYSSRKEEAASFVEWMLSTVNN